MDVSAGELSVRQIVLIIATVSRTSPLVDLLESVIQQDACARIRIILVDQNNDTRLSDVVNRFSGTVDILWVGSRLGLSRARNVGLRLLDGDGIVGFPDDDCKYPEGFLQSLLDVFDARGADFVSVRELGPDGSTDTRAPSKEGHIHRYNVWRACGSNRTFFTTAAVAAIGDFDENLGLGAGTAWEGGEDIDYPIRGLKSGLRGWFTPALHVVHVGTIARGRGPGADRVFAYNASMGRVWRRHDYRRWWLIYQGLRPVGGILVAGLRGDTALVRHHWNALRGRVWGWSNG